MIMLVIERNTRFSLYILCIAIIVRYVNCQGFANHGYHQPFYQPYDKTSDRNGLTECRISTRDLIATAQSAANRILQGVCNPRELNDRFFNLENQIVDQFNVLKTMVLNIEDKLREQDEKNKVQHRKMQRVLASMRSHRKETPGESRAPQKDNAVSSPTFEGGYEPFSFYDDTDEDYIEDVSAKPIPSLRDKEIQQYNSSIQHQDEGRIFTYYWRVKSMPDRMKNWGWRRSLRSDSFYIFRGGYRMYMRLFPNHNGTNVYIHVGITKGDFDDSLSWPFKLRHKIQILDDTERPQDISSRIWDPTQLCSGWNWKKPDHGDNYECVGLGFEQKMLKTRNYLLNDAITIKLSVYLDR